MNTVIPRGNIEASLVVVGDVPTVDDLKQGISFSGITGELLADIIKQSGFELEDTLLINVAPFRKYGNSQLSTTELLEFRNSHVLPILNKAPRKTIICLGNAALFTLGVADKLQGVNALRGKRLKSPLVPEATIYASIHPYFVVQNPDEVDDFYADFRFANRGHKGDLSDQVPLYISDIETIEDLITLEKEIKEKGLVAYDFETDDLDRDTAKVISCSFYTFQQEGQTGAYKVWFWAAYDRLVPRFSEEKLEEFRQRFTSIFLQAGTNFKQIGWNCNFDDWIAETWAKVPLPGSTYDGQLMKWVVNNGGYHNLKDSTEKYLGYANYEAGLLEFVREIKARRNKILTHEDDFRALEWKGVQPDISASGKPKWPKTLDKGFAAYALVPYDILRTYNCYDAVYTGLLFDLFKERIINEGLNKSAQLRHQIVKDLLRCEQRGFLLDVEANRKLSHQLTVIKDRCETLVQAEVLKLNPDAVDFNLNSNQQLALLLFGRPIEIPSLNRNAVFKALKVYESWKLDKQIKAVEAKFYGDYSKIKKSIATGGYDYDTVAKLLTEYAAKEFPIEAILIESKPLYCNGLYTPKFFTKGGEPSCASAVLQSLFNEKEEPLLKYMIMYRKAVKILNTFVDKIYACRNSEDVVKSKYNGTGTNTGRISSSDPINWQNFPEKVRGQFKSRPGFKFVNGDLSQAEVRGVAAYSEDEDLIRAVDAQDIHRAIASLVYNKPEEEISSEERRATKTTVFGIIYGIGPDKLALALGKTVQEAQDLIDLFFTRFPGVKKWLNKQIESASKPPFYVYTPWGTRRSTRGTLSVDNRVKMHTERVACNMPIQGAAGELTLWYIHKLLTLAKEKKWDVYLVNTTHDSFTFEVPDALCEDFEKLIVSTVESRVDISPLDKVIFRVDTKIQTNWYGDIDVKKTLDPREDKFDWEIFSDVSEELDIVCQ